MFSGFPVREKFNKIAGLDLSVHDILYSTISSMKRLPSENHYSSVVMNIATIFANMQMTPITNVQAPHIPSSS